MSGGDAGAGGWGKLRVTALLSALGAVAGAVAGVALTFLGNVISGYPLLPPLEVYLANSAYVAVAGAVLAPPIAWSTLRAVPLWRAALETAAGGVLGGALSMLFAPGLFVFAIPAGIGLAAGRLSLSYSSSRRAALGRGDEAEAHRVLGE